MDSIASGMLKNFTICIITEDPQNRAKVTKSDLSYKKVRTCEAGEKPYNDKHREQNSTLNKKWR